jgi:hypothetical protein
MKKLFYLFLFSGITLFPMRSFGIVGRYQKGNIVYREKLSSCAMWYRRLGDISKSNGKWLKRGPDLAKDLGKYPKKYILKWLANPRGVSPKVNCRIKRLTTKREVSDLIHYMKRRALNPPKKTKIVRKPFKRSKIRLLRTRIILRKRIKTWKDIKKWKLKIPKKTGKTIIKKLKIEKKK